MAWLRLEKRRPDAGEADTERVSHFLAQLRAFPVTDDLARLPYDCERLLEFYSANTRPADEVEKPGANLPRDEYELLDYALEKLMRREWEKHHQVRDGTLVPETTFVEGWKSLLLAFGRFSVPSGSIRNQIEEGYAPIGEAALRVKLEEAAYIHRRRALAGRFGRRRRWTDDTIADCALQADEIVGYKHRGARERRAHSATVPTVLGGSRRQRRFHSRDHGGLFRQRAMRFDWCERTLRDSAMLSGAPRAKRRARLFGLSAT